MAEEATFAWIDIWSGRALVVRPGGETFVFEIRRDAAVAGPDVPEDALNLGLWMPHDARVRLEGDPGAYPFRVVGDALREKFLLERMRIMFLLALDSSEDSETRAEAGEALGELCAHGGEAAAGKFREILLAEPLPAAPGCSTVDAPLTGRAAELLAAAVAKWGPRVPVGV